MTPAQKSLLAKPEAQAIIEGASQIEETKEEATTTCTIEVLAVKKLEETKSEEENEAVTIACCVDFSYKDKSPKKLDVEK